MFERYTSNSDIFVETGSHLGDTCVKAAIAGYKKIYSCDINKSYVMSTRQKMKSYNNVECDIQHNSSEEFLKELLPTLETRVTFWLDAHGWGGGCPTYDELALIDSLCRVRDNNILIDDIHLFFKNDIEKLQNTILKINPNYTFTFEVLHADGSDNVMIATVEEAG